MNLKLKSKKVFISGSSRGIGLGIAKKFVDEGADVVINSRNSADLKAIESTMKVCGSVVGNLCDPGEAAAAVAQSVEIMGGLDIVVCNVGSGSSVSPGLETYNEWQRVFNVNFFSTTNLVEASKADLKRSKGSIVCISSICGNEAIPAAPITYSVAKSAINAYVKRIAIPLALDGIRINAVAPGNIFFTGSTWAKKLASDPDSVKSMLKNTVPLGEFGSPEDVASLTAWLSSSEARFVTGAIYTTDGGQTRS